MNRKPATAQRAARYGMANQMAHEKKGRVERNALQTAMAESKAAALRKAAGRKRQSETGMNSGTVGGSWLESMTRKR